VRAAVLWAVRERERDTISAKGVTGEVEFVCFKNRSHTHTHTHTNRPIQAKGADTVCLSFRTPH
jgi:hypothetical protein